MLELQQWQPYAATTAPSLRAFLRIIAQNMAVFAYYFVNLHPITGDDGKKEGQKGKLRT